ncbi:MAG: hypothetical protein H6832_16665, partial [Planctomycetes bacterium]|nr:hypothetical protein [Planctomycetota bacterium]
AKQGIGQRWERQANFGEGDIHKLILVNSPQSGSPIANFVTFFTESDLWRRLFSEYDFPAFDDLRQNSPALMQMGQTDIPAASIVGVGGRDFLSRASNQLRFLGRLLSPYPGAAQALSRVATFLGRATPIAADALFGSEEHDVVVLESSQGAQLANNYRNVVLGDTSLHWNVTSSAAYMALVRAWLDSDIDGLAVGLPPVPKSTTTFRPPVLPALRIGLWLSRRFVPSKSNGAIALSVSGVSGFAPTSIDVFTPWGDVLEVKAPFEVDITPPADFRGAARFVAIANDSTGEFAISNDLFVSVPATAPLTSLDVDPPELTFIAPYQELRISVTAMFADGGRQRLLPDEVSFSSSHPDVIAISRAGTLTALAPGDASISCSYGGVTFKRQLHVSYGPVVGYGTATRGKGDIEPTIGTADQMPILANTRFRWSVSGVVGGAPGVVLHSPKPTRIEFPFGILWVDLNAALPFVVVADGASGVAGAGAVEFPWSIPNDINLVDRQVYSQAVFVDAGSIGGLSMTWGLAIRFLPAG